MKKIISCCIISFVVMSNAEARTMGEECVYLKVSITNLTKKECTLLSQKVNGGFLINAPPASIPPEYVGIFALKQAGYGPDITVSYQCGEESITFTSQQNFCMLEAGDITGTIVHPLPRNLNARYSALPGSFFWDTHGSIEWQIIDISKG